ncbi:MAG: DUF4282 domain-containing protein [Alcanivoracaceae bacterium]|nr:DUF4282 domain-containing protein [Alcanivoracaceae bacterium]
MRSDHDNHQSPSSSQPDAFEVGRKKAAYERRPVSEPIPQRGVISSFTDWRFEQYLTMRLLPLFYLLLVLGAVVVIGAIVAGTFYFSMFAGFIALGVAPLVLLVAVAVIRAALEYLIMAHRIMRIIERMDALPDQVEDLSVRVEGITDHVDNLTGRVEDIHKTLMQVRPLLDISALPRRVLRSLLRQD